MSPRKKHDAEDIPLVPEEQFEDAMRAVLGASNKRVGKKFDEMQASNKRRREERKPEADKR